MSFKWSSAPGTCLRVLHRHARDSSLYIRDT